MEIGRKILNLFVFLFTINCVLAEYINHRFNSVPTTVKTFENDTVMLPCSVNGPYHYTRWIREETVLADSRYPEIRPPDRFFLCPNSSLLVSQVQPDDTGEYLCEIMLDDDEQITQLHHIEIQVPPSVQSDPSGRFEVKIGSVFEIVCEAQGVPQPIISWQRNGKNITDQLENNRRLLIEVLSRDMAGPIECVANNRVGEPAVAGIDLVVLFPPEVKASPSIIHTKIGFRANLECYVISAPAATVHWFHHGVPLILDNHLGRHDTDLDTFKKNSNYHTNSRHTLIVKNVKDFDLGMYECRAENKLGYKGAIIELTGRPMPSIFKTSPIVSSPMTHNLIWQTESLSPISEYKLKFRKIPSGNLTPNSRFPHIDWIEITVPAEFSNGPIHSIGYTLSGLLPASVYEVAVISRNRYGWSDISKVVRFATGGEIEVPEYSTETIEYDEINENEITDLMPLSHYNKNYSTSATTSLGCHLINCGFIVILSFICNYFSQRQ